MLRHENNVMALGELWRMQRGLQNFLVVKVGTGIGCGVVCHGQVYRGANGSAGDLVVPQRAPLVDAVERRMTVRDLLTPGRTNSGSIQYPKETGFTNSAATHTETGGTAKPQSEIKFDIVTATVTTIASITSAATRRQKPA